MQTGDGLLARLIIHEPLSLHQLSALCSAAAEHGNGIIEVTQRGSLQVRGLTETSTLKFADALARLRTGTGRGIGDDSGPPLVTSPLLGLDTNEAFDSTDVVTSMLDAFQGAREELNSLAAKVSVLVDGGGGLHLDAIRADIRLVARHNTGGVLGRTMVLSLAGTATGATCLGYVKADQATAAVMTLLRLLARRGPTARAQDLLHEAGLRELRLALDDYLREPNDGYFLEPNHARPDAVCLDDVRPDDVRPDDTSPAQTPAPALRRPAEPIGQHLLKDGTHALGFALPFGYTTASALERVAKAAADRGAIAIRPAPGRAFLVIGLSQNAANGLGESLATEGFVVDVHDVRRHVVACAGAPACACAQLRTRQLAPEVARATTSWAGTSKVIHLAGCSKGCAHPGPASLTIVGPDRLILNGRASDNPNMTVRADSLLADITRLCRSLT